MTAQSFVYWLQGYFELSAADGALDTRQTALIKAHLAMVFKHEIDPSMGDGKHQEELKDIHSRVDEKVDKRMEEFKRELLRKRSSSRGDEKYTC
jgi:hypothetical protein